MARQSDTSSYTTMSDSLSTESYHPTREDPVVDAATSSHARRPKETVTGFSSEIALDEHTREGSSVEKNVTDNVEQPDAHEGSKIEKPSGKVRGEQANVTQGVEDNPRAETINVEELSDNELLATVVPRIAKRVRSRREKKAVEQKYPSKEVGETNPHRQPGTESTHKRKGYGPAKSWSKEVPKKLKTKAVVVESESDVPCDVTTSMSRKKPSSSKLAASVPEVPIDNVSFHFPSSVNRWKYVYHKRLALERELTQNTLDCKEIVDLIKEAGLMRTVSQLPKCYETLVKEFIVNLSEECADGKSTEFRKHVPDIVLTSGETSKAGNQPDKADVIAVLKETCKELEARKHALEKLILQLETAAEDTDGPDRQSSEEDEEANSEEEADDEAED
ncbi:uncharacterized protein LOC127131104 [Lathyrus oleraceus]|uniref:uncharacterized protein LOC127131104 n=1 Tax=Pisum sativum TaxID=3888 RepID=UPI0021CFFFD2|nr:uncharacterized protein LOC127131104 [Pisum sativum]